MASLKATVYRAVSFVFAACLCFVLAPRSAMAQTNITGTWSGTYTLSMGCQNGSTLASSGNATGIFTQTGTAFDGFLLLETFQLADPQTCTLFGSYTIGLPLQGSVSGSTLTATLTTFGGPASVTGSISGTQMSATVTGAEASGTLTLTQTSTQPPTGSAATYIGTYNASNNVSSICSNITSVNFSGPATVQTNQFGSQLYGSAVISNTKTVQSSSGTCTVVDSGDGTLTFSGTLSGSNVTGTALAGDLTLPFTATVTTQSFSGTASDGTNTVSITATRSSSAPPTVTSFIATPATITAGASSILSWATTGATGVTIDNGVGAQPATGSVTVTPAATTTYILTATGPGGSATASVTVTVSAAVPRVGISSFPTGMVQVAGRGGATDSFTLTNSGGLDTTVTLSTAATFFTLSSTSLTLRAGASQVVTVTGQPQAAGTHEGTVSVSGNGVPSSMSVPVRLLSSAAPTGTVLLSASILRGEVSGPAGSNPSGGIQFTNKGTASLEGIAVSDVPWLIPDASLISIPPGLSRTISFSIDRSRRLDAGSLAGGASCKLSIRFLSGTAAKRDPNADPVSGTSTVSVTVVDVVTPNVAAGSPPAIASGEVAFFIPGISQKTKAVGDVAIASRASLSNVRMYLGGAGLSPKFATLGSIAPDKSVAFQGVLKNAFGVTSQTGTLQLRGVNAETASVAATQINTSASEGTYGWQLPLFRSDRGIASGALLTLAGVTGSAATRTDLFIQEVVGADAKVQIEMFDAQGARVGNRPVDSIGPFGLLEISSDAVPPNVASLRVTNTSTSGAKVAAYGVVVDATTGDSWPVLDWPGYFGATPSATTVVPVPAAATQAQTDLYLTNNRTSAADVTLTFAPSGSRRRLLRRPSTAAGAIATDSATVSNSFTIAAGQTLRLPDVLKATFGATNGSGGSIAVKGSVSVTARTLMTVAGRSGTFGTGLPALPQGSGLSSGRLQRFAGVNDASDATVHTATPATYRTHLGLVETSGQPATVRVVLRYSFSATATAAAFTGASKDFTLAANQFTFVRDLADAVIGAQRASFGDLRGMQIDVSVVSGSGHVVPFLTQVESSSGDVMLRTE